MFNKFLGLTLYFLCVTIEIYVLYLFLNNLGNLDIPFSQKVCAYLGSFAIFVPLIICQILMQVAEFSSNFEKYLESKGIVVHEM